MSDWNGNTATIEQEDTIRAAGTGDPEVDALATITRTLDGLDDAARARVMAFANDRFGSTPTTTARRGK